MCSIPALLHSPVQYVVQFSAVSYDYPAFSVYLTQYLTEHAEADIQKK